MLLSKENIKNLKKGEMIVIKEIYTGREFLYVVSNYENNYIVLLDINNNLIDKADIFLYNKTWEAYIV